MQPVQANVPVKASSKNPFAAALSTEIAAPVMQPPMMGGGDVLSSLAGPMASMSSGSLAKPTNAGSSSFMDLI